MDWNTADVDSDFICYVYAQRECNFAKNVDYVWSNHRLGVILL